MYEAHDGGVTLRKLSRTHQISAATVERWYQHHLGRKKSEMANKVCPRVLGIDEHFFTRKKGYATTFVDLAKGKKGTEGFIFEQLWASEMILD